MCVKGCWHSHGVLPLSVSSGLVLFALKRFLIQELGGPEYALVFLLLERLDPKGLSLKCLPYYHRTELGV